MVCGLGLEEDAAIARDRGHELVTPTHTGLGERSHLARPDIDLDAHIADVLCVLRFEDLRDVFLVGHSDGGMVATGVADRASERIAHLVYLDAFVPKDGQSLADLAGAAAHARVVAAAREHGEGWRVPVLRKNPVSWHHCLSRLKAERCGTMSAWSPSRGSHCV